MKVIFRLLLLAAIVCAVALAQPPPVNIVIDENGHGQITFVGSSTPMLWAMQNDPGWPGGVSQFPVLTYSMMGPPSVVTGDVLMSGVPSDNGNIFDVIRFNDYRTGGDPNYVASILIYSDSVDGVDALGDTPGLPPIYPNNVTILEVGSDGNNWGDWHPGPGQPGYVPGYDVSYRFYSDVPEPGSVLLMISGLGLVLAGRRFVWR